MCYVTLRGLVYFGASIHVYHGVQMLVNMYYDLFANNASREVNNVTQVDIIFNCCFLTLGILIFRGVEQKSKTFIKWPTIGFTLLLAFRFIVELVKQVEREREFNSAKPTQHHLSKNSLSPFSYSSMSVEVDPFLSASVGIYIFVLFVYNHSLEYHPEVNSPSNANSSLPFHHNHSNSRGHDPHRHSSSVNSSDCGGVSDASSDTVQLISNSNSNNNNNFNLTPNSGDNNNNNNSQRGVNSHRNRLISLTLPINTRANPLFELQAQSQSLTLAQAQQNQQPNCNSLLGIHPPQSPSELIDYKIDAV